MPDNKEFEKYLAAKSIAKNKEIAQASSDTEFQKYLNAKSVDQSKLNSQFSTLEGEYQLDSQYDVFLKPGMDQESLRGEKQGFGSELANAVGGGIAKIPFSVIGNVASILDFEDYYNTDNEVGNSVTAWAEEMKGNIEGATKIYRSNENTLSSREWWMNNAKGLIDSAGGFIFTGGILGKGVNLLSNLAKGSQVIKGVGAVTNAAMLNQAESVPIAMDVYKTSYEFEFKKQTDLGVSEEQADLKAQQTASDAAAYSISINRINIPLNLTSASAFLRTPALTRQIAKDYTKKEVVGNLIKEGTQEYVEENVNMIAEKEAIRKAKAGNDYTYSFDRTLNDVMSKEGFETGVVGFFGGAVQTAGTNLLKSFQKDSPSYDENGNVRFNDLGQPVLVSPKTSQKERFRAQQKSLQNIEMMAKTEGLPSVREALENVRTTSEILNNIQIAAVNNDLETVASLQNELLSNQALDAFKNGTTDKLINLYESVSRDPNSKEKLGENHAMRAVEAVKQIEELEKVYQKLHGSQYSNDLFTNRAKHYFTIKEAEKIQKEVMLAKSEQAKEISIVGYTTPEQILTLQTTKELISVNEKMGAKALEIIALQEDYNTILQGKKDKSKSPLDNSPLFKDEDEEAEKNKEAVGEFAKRILAGEQMDLPEDLKFYEDNKEEIEALLKTPPNDADADDFNPEDIDNAIDAAITGGASKPKPVILNQSSVSLSTTPEDNGENIPEKFGEVVPKETKEKRKEFEANVISHVNSLISKGEDINSHIELKPMQKGYHLNAGIFLDEKHIGNVNGLATDDFTKDLLKKIKEGSANRYSPKDLGIYFGLTDGSLDIVPNGKEQPLVADLNIDLSLTGGQHLIYDFTSRTGNQYTTGHFMGTIDEDLFVPGVQIDEKAIPKDLGRYVLVVPMPNGAVKYIRVRPAKLNKLSEGKTDQIFKDLKEQAESVKAESTVDKDATFKFNRELNEGFFIAVDSKLKIKDKTFDSYSISLGITVGDASGGGKGKIRVSVQGYSKVNNQERESEVFFIEPSKVDSMEDLLNIINSSSGGTLKLSKNDFKASIIETNAVNNMTSSVNTNIIKSQSLVFKKATSIASTPASEDLNKDSEEDDHYTKNIKRRKKEELDKKADIERRRQEELTPYSINYIESKIKKLNPKDNDTIHSLWNLYTYGRYSGNVQIGGIGLIDKKGIITKQNFLEAVYNTFGEKYGDYTASFIENEESEDSANEKYNRKEINAKYDAELTALEAPISDKKADIERRGQEELSALLKQKAEMIKDINSDPRKIREISTAINELKKQIESGFSPDAFKINDLNGEPLSQSEIDEVKKMLPKFIDIQDLSKIMENLRANGMPLGVFRDKIIYLNSLSATKGTAYHEAFHAIFRTVLSEKEIVSLLAQAKKEYHSKHSASDLRIAIDNLRNYSEQYNSLSNLELEELVYEEYMADKFEQFKKDESTKNPFRRLFIIIRNLFKVFSNNSEEMSALFEKISNNEFSNSTLKDNRFNGNISLPVFKLIPAGIEEMFDEFTGKTKFIPVNHTQQKSNKLISTFAAKINKALRGEYGEELSKLDKKDLFDYFVNERIDSLTNDKFYDYLETLKGNTALYLKVTSAANKELNTYEDDVFKSVLKEQVEKRLKILKYEPKNEDGGDDAGSENSELNDIKEKLGSQDAWLSGGHDSLPNVIKEYISFSTYEEFDPIIGEFVEVAVDAITAYNGLTRILADTPRTNMINKLQSVSRYNLNMKAVLDRLIEDTGIMTNEDGSLSQPTRNFNDYQMFLNTFDNSLTGQIFTLVDKDNNYKVMPANTNQAKKVSVTNWASNIRNILENTGMSNEQLSEKFNDVVKEFNKGIKSYTSEDKLNDKVKAIKNALKETGIELSEGYIEYSLLFEKRALGVKISQAQDATIDLNEGVAPLSMGLFKGVDKFDGIIKMIHRGENIFSTEKDKGANTRMEEIAEGNGMFDETIGNASFKNAEGKSVYEIIKSSYVLSQAKKMNSDNYLKKLKSGVDENNDLNDRNFKFIKNNFLLNKYRNIVKDLKINIIDGLRHEDSENGSVFGDYDGRTYLVQGLAFFAAKTKNNTAKYIFRQNEASNTGYIAELPVEQFSDKNKANSKVIDVLYDNFKNEFDRIGRETDEFGQTIKYKNYNNTKEGRAFDFTEFKYLEDLDKELYDKLVGLAKENNEKDIPINEVKVLIGQYLNEGILRYKDNLLKYGVIYKKKDSNEFASNYIPKDFFGENGRYNSLDEAIAEMYLNDYIMSNSLNELLDGDYAISRKDKVDISKRNKGAMGSGNSYGTGTHRVSYIKDILGWVKKKAENGNLTRTNNEGEEIVTNDAQSYQSIYHKIFALHALGKMDKKTWGIYKKVIKAPNNINIKVEVTGKDQSYLENNRASLNPDKTVTFGMGIYHKTSEHTLARGVISYVPKSNALQFEELTDELIALLDARNFDKNEITKITKKISKLYEPIPGMEYHHNLANQMDKYGIDQVITESASKGATLIPVDSQSENLDLSLSMIDVPNEYKRLQTETPTGSDTVTDGSQMIQIIDSEQNDSIKITVNGVETTIGKVRKEYRKLTSTSRKNSFKAAMSYIKDIEGGKIDKSKLDKKLVKALEASGADEVLLELFGHPYNFNMSNMIDKAEQIVLAHFGKGVLNQKVPGTKVSLVSDAGIEILRNKDGSVVPLQDIYKNPEKYKNWENRGKLEHNKKYPDGSVYSECILSEKVLLKHGLKVGDEIPQELMIAFGYRIPTDDKHSKMALKIVGLLPNYMEGVGIFPMEIVYLSGADFDIDSEFIQTHDFWIKNGKAIKYGTEKTLEDKWKAFIYYKLNVDKEFGSQYQSNKKTDPMTEEIKGSENFNELNKEIKERALILTLSEFKLPTSFEEFSGLKEPDMLNNGVLNNKILDNRIALLTNSEMLKEIAYTPSSTKKLRDVANEIDKLKETGSKYKVKNKNVSASDLNGKFDSNVKNSAGKESIGIVANKLQVFNFLAKAGAKLSEGAFNFMIGGFVGTGYNYKNKEGGRVSDSLSTELSVMTDNAKDPIAGQLGLSKELLSGYSELIAQGLPDYYAGLLINLPLLQIYSYDKKVMRYSIKSKVEAGITKSKTVKYSISKLLGKELKEIDDAFIKEAMGKMENISKEDMEDIISGKMQDKAMSDAIQINALLQFSEIEKISDSTSNINAFLKINQGLSTSFVDLREKMEKAFKELGLTKTGHDDPNVEVPVRIGMALQSDKLTLDNVMRAMKVLERGEKMFISQTKTFIKAFNQIKDILNPSYINQKDSAKEVGKSLLGYISTKGYMNMIKKIISDKNTPESIRAAYAKRLENIDSRLIYKGLDGETLGEQLIKLKNSPNDDVRANPLIKYLQSSTDDEQRLDIVSSKSFAKESKEYISVLLDGYKALYNNKETREFAINMFNYLIIKDDLEFKSGTFVKFVAPFMFEKLSQSLDITLAGLIRPEAEEKSILGEDFDHLSYEFRKKFATYIGNNFSKNNKGKIKYRALKGGKGYVIAENTITFNIFNADKTIDKEGAKYLSEVFDTASDKQGHKTYLFPQFIKFDKKLYELRAFKEFDKIKYHPLKDSVHEGSSAIYEEIEIVGNKKVSPYPVSYEKNLELNEIQPKKKVKEEFEDFAAMAAEASQAFQNDDFEAAMESAVLKTNTIEGSKSIEFDNSTASKKKSKYEISAADLTSEKLDSSKENSILDITHQSMKNDLMKAGITVPETATQKDVLELFKKYCKGK